MAKYECELTGSFVNFLSRVEQGILSGSISATLEDASNYHIDDVRCAVRVFERYSWIGKNRVSLSLTLLGKGDQLFLSAITAGGSQAMFMKINTWGEEAFLDKLVEIVKAFQRVR
ncbi:MAG: DUF6054 family protein [Clostridiales bacterium]|nr:DUF6054 family protein [Clostridiales bacterium]